MTAAATYYATVSEAANMAGVPLTAEQAEQVLAPAWEAAQKHAANADEFNAAMKAAGVKVITLLVRATQ